MIGNELLTRPRFNLTALVLIHFEQFVVNPFSAFEPKTSATRVVRCPLNPDILAKLNSFGAHRVNK